MSKIYQFAIALMETEPKIWRRIQVPENYNFAEFSTAIVCAMGWAGGRHLHEFAVKRPNTGEMIRIGPPREDFGMADMIEQMQQIISENIAKIQDYFLASSDTAMFLYDFGDNWVHQIVLENILPAIGGETYPKCIAGELACPPEDCGGISGFYELLKILTDPSHKEYEEYKQWIEEECGAGYDPKKFDAAKVSFYPLI